MRKARALPTDPYLGRCGAPLRLAGALAPLLLALAGCGGSGGGPDPGEAQPLMNCDGTPIAADGAEDPFLARQWHLRNMGGGSDLNLGSVWSQTRGRGLLMSVVDDGLDIGHEDLAVNVRPGASHNFYAGMPGFSASATDPTPSTAAAAQAPAHGTNVGGIMGARDRNGLGVSGIAGRACLAGFNLIASGYQMGDDARALTTNAVADLAVSNNSWGATDGLGIPAASSMPFRDAVTTGLAMGRGGRGAVYLWAAGNGSRLQGGLDTDNSNYDGQANFPGVMAIGGVMDNGVRVPYSEKGANVWVVAFSQTTTFDTDGRGITSTDITGPAGYNTQPAGTNPMDTSLMGNNYLNGNYNQSFNGTSSATPEAAGVVTLVLSANRALTPRDVRLILAETARMTDPMNADWVMNRGTRSDGRVGFPVNHEYGFGLIDAQAAVARATTWSNVGPQVAGYDSGDQAVGMAFADNDMNGASAQINVTGSPIGRIEYVSVYLTAAGADVGDVDVRLEGSAGTASLLAEPHNCFANGPRDAQPAALCGGAYGGWRFGSVRHLGESANQTWTLRVSDRRQGNTTGGTFTSWRLVIEGRAQ